MASKRKRKITVINPIFTVTFEENEDIFLKTNSIMKAVEFLQSGEVVTMEATDSNGEQVTTKSLKKFTISFRTGQWKVATEDTVYKITSK